jgi:basic membrane lipoprotein Med (substrate-binding protein (PBP1-ABC) superfamily)
MITKPPLKAVTGIAVGVLALVFVVFVAVLFGKDFTADQKTMVITATVAALGVIGGYFFNSSADQAAKDAPPNAPATVTTTVTTGVPPAEPAA